MWVFFDLNFINNELEILNQFIENNKFKRRKDKIEKDTDRVENAYRVYIALETGDIDSLLEDSETLKWLEEYDRESKEKQGQEVEGQ